MIKKLFFAGALVLAFNTINAQVEVWQDYFDDEDISDWTLYDEDGDGYEWNVAQLTSSGSPSGTPILTSVSWSGSPLTPDNWAVSPSIDLTNASGNITFKWSVFASDPSYNLENYGIYVSTENTVEALIAGGELFTEVDLPDTLTERTLDLSSFAGQKIYIAFRHYDVTDQFRIGIDNVSIEAGVLAVSDVNKKSVSVYPNPTTDYLTLSQKVNSAEVYDLSGKLVASPVIIDSKIDVKSLQNGVYILKINTEVGSTSLKFIKK